MATPVSKWLIPLIVIAIIAGVAIAMWFYFFGKAGSAAALVPSDEMIYVRLSTAEQSGEPVSDLPAAADLADMFWKGFANQNPFFSYEDDIKPWLGEELVLAKASPDLVDPFVVLAEVGNKSEALETVEKLKGKMGHQGGELVQERYKGVDLYHLKGLFNMAGGYVKGYLVLSTSLKGVKEIIDVSNGDTPSLASNADFRNLNRNLANKDNRLVVALKLKEALEATTAALGTTERLMVKQLNLPPELRLGLAIRPEGQDLRLEAYVGSGLIANWETMSPKLLNSAPQNALAYFEGKDLARVIINWAGQDMSISPESLNWLTGEYAIAWLPREEKKSSLGLILEIGDDDVARAKMRAAEPALVSVLDRWGIKGGGEFRDGTAAGIASRYASFNEGLKMDINYAVTDHKIFLATSQEGLSDLLDTAKGNRLSLQESAVFDELLKKIQGGDLVSLLFLNSAAITAWLGPKAADATGDDPAEPAPASDFLNQILAPYQGLGLAIKKTEAGALIADIYLPAK